MTQNGNRAWSRPESLVGIVKAAWAEISPEESLAEELAAEDHSNVLAAYLHRLKRHVRDLTHFVPSWVEDLPNSIMRSILGSAAPSLSQRLQRDTFGFNKIVLVATERGRLVAFSTGAQGKIIWNIQAAQPPTDQVWKVSGLEIQDGTVVVRAKGEETLQVQISSGNVTQDPAVLGAPKDQSATRTIIATQEADGTVRGWNKDQETVAWRFVPEPGDEISSIATRPVRDPVASIGKALGDRNVLYKYLNPNTLFLATINKDISVATIYLIDSVSGDILYTTSHRDVDASHQIVSTMAENFFAYTLKLNSKSDSSSAKSPSPKGYQLLMTELFESSIPNDRGPLGSASNFSSIAPTLHAPSSPYAASQAYLLPGPICALTTTSTLQSITPRSLLALLSVTNSLISIPRSVLDPRRPVARDPTPAEAEEGLFRHHPILDFEPKWVLNHKREILGLKEIMTTPTALESTSAIFAWGTLDVFGTRVSPIGGFDSLGRGFSRGQLVLTVAGLAIGTGIVSPLVSCPNWRNVTQC